MNGVNKLLPVDKYKNNNDCYPQAEIKPAQWVAGRLREDIASGMYPPNSFLPSQRSLAELLGVPRRVVRIAFEQLKVSGLIEPSRGRGTRVLPKGERTVRQQIAYIHAPIRSWNGLESHHIRDGILRRLQQLDYDCTEVIIYNKNAVPVHEVGGQVTTINELPDLLKKFSAFIFHEASLLVADLITDFVSREMPVVVANLEIDMDVSATLIDHESVSMNAVETLASFGHKHIAYLGTNPCQAFYGMALNGFRKGMQAANLDVDETLITLCEKSSSLAAYKAALPLVQCSDPPTAIVAARDSIAAGVCQAIREAGLEVGRDISVIGFDDVSWDGPEPFLTTFHEPCTEMGAIAVDMLMDRIQNVELPVEQRVLDAPLILRRSVGLPRR